MSAKERVGDFLASSSRHVEMFTSIRVTQAQRRSLLETMLPPRLRLSPSGQAKRSSAMRPLFLDAASNGAFLAGSSFTVSHSMSLCLSGRWPPRRPHTYAAKLLSIHVRSRRLV